MKKARNRVISLMLSALVLVCISGQKVKAQDAEVSYQSFYDDLSPYGQWVNDGQYGNVWVPNEEGDFRPYGSRGHWVMTDYGNTWVSDDPWGWACYHYGRWTYDQYYGWVWIPGYEWAPAWVSWRYGGGYSGWAPLGPGVAVGYSNCPESWWVFVQPQYMYRDDCYHHWRGPSYNGTYMRQTTVINNYYADNRTHVRYNYGPRGEDIQRYTHQPVQVYHVNPSGRPGAPGISGRNVNMYRPEVNRATATSARPSNVMQAPRQIGRPQAATTVSASHQPAFRQQVQRGAVPQQQPQTQGRQSPQQLQPQGRQQQQPMQQQRQQPAQQPQRQQPMQQQRQQPAEQQQRQQPAQQPQRQQPMQQQRQQSAEQQQRQQPMQQRQQPAEQQQRQQPMEQQRQQPAQQPQRQQPMQQQRQQPAEQPQRQQPMPQQQRQQSAEQQQRQQPMQQQQQRQQQQQQQQQQQRQQPAPQRQQPMQQQQQSRPQPQQQHEEGRR
jgi:hypothetical protein